MDEAFFEKLLDDFFAEAVDVEAGFADGVADALVLLSGTIWIYAADSDAVAVAEDGLMTAGTFFRKLVRLGIFRTKFGQGLDYFGDDVAGFADDDGVPYPDILAGNFVSVVQVSGSVRGRPRNSGRFRSQWSTPREGER